MEAEIDISKEKQEKEEIRSEKPKEKGKRKQEDKQLPKANEETLKDEGQRMHSKDDLKVAMNSPPPPPPSISDRGKSDIEGGKSVNPQGLCCPVCHEPFDVDEIPKRRKYHIRCYKDRYKCNVCHKGIPLNEEGKRECKCHPFWKKNYCPVHDNDGTPKCCSCEKLKPQEETPQGETYVYVTFEDGRKLCLECMESALMDSDECQHLQFDMREFFECLHMKIEKQFHFLLVEQQELNKAAEKA